MVGKNDTHMLDICHHVVSPLQEYDAGFRALDFIFFAKQFLVSDLLFMFHMSWQGVNQFRYYEKDRFFLGPKNHCSRALGSGARERKSFCIILHELVLCDLVKGSQSWKNGVVAWNHMPLLQKNETGFGPDFFLLWGKIVLEFVQVAPKTKSQFACSFALKNCRRWTNLE